MATNYPNQIDDTITLPVVADNVNRVSADVINRLRAAILAVESELGVRPSGISGTIRNRLDETDLIIASLNDAITELEAGGGGGEVAGSDTQIQFNDGGAFGGDAGLTYDKTANVLSISDAIALNGSTAAAGNIRLEAPVASETQWIQFSQAAVDYEFLKIDTTAGAITLGGVSHNSALRGYQTSISSLAGNLISLVSNGTTCMSMTDALVSVPLPIAIGATPATSGTIRLPKSATIIAMNSLDTLALNALSINDDNVFVGTDSAFTSAKQFSNVHLYGTQTVAQGLGGTTYTYVYNGNIEAWKPMIGSSGGSSPYGVHGVGVQAMADANQTPTASVYCFNTIKTTDALTGNKTLTLPAATDAAGYTKVINNTCTGDFSVIVGDGGAGTTVAVINGETDTILFDSRGATKTSITATNILTIGSPAASAGTVRLPNATAINFRDSGNTADIPLITTSGANVTIANQTSVGALSMYANAVGLWGTGSVGVYNPSGSGYALLVEASKTTLEITTTEQTGNVDGKVIDVIRSEQTTDATITDLYTWTLIDDAVTTIDVMVNAISDDGAAGGVWKRSYTLRVDTGVVTAIGTVHDAQTDEDSASWDVTIDDDGAGDGRVRVTGEIGVNINWYGAIRIQSAFVV